MAIVNDWLSERVGTDLAAFSDPGTTVSLNKTKDWLQATWTHRGRDVTDNFRAKPKASYNVVVRTEAGPDEPYAAFLSGDRMADLKAIAKNTSRALRPVAGYVQPRAYVDEVGNRQNAEAELEQLARIPDARTKLIFVTADAGVGKTTLLSEIVRRKATDYALARTDALWLYVNAQGSRLARLDQALAAALDDVRAPFPYHAVAPLVRAGALVLVIDGFDELIGAPGTYDDAYSSLASFLTALDGHGTIVATARSAYYEQEFLTKVGTVPGLAEEAWSLTRVELLEWNLDERMSFLSAFAKTHQVPEAERDSFPEHVLSLFETSNARDLAAKPFFLARVAEFALDGKGLEAGPSMLDQLVNTYLARESEGKLLTGLGRAVLSVEQFAQIYEEIADEMWRQETRELSASSFRELIDVMAQLLELEDHARAAVVDRLPNSAFVHPGSSPGSIAFQHEIFFAYFLARPIIASVRSADSFTIGSALRKGRLPNQAGDIIGRALVGDAHTIIAAIGKAPTAVSIGIDQIRQNGGVIVAAMMRMKLGSNIVIADINFVDVDLSLVEVSGLSFKGCTFRAVDFRGARFAGCRASQTQFVSILVDDSTRLGLIGPTVNDFLGLRFEGADGHAGSVYAPTEIQRILTRAELPAARETLELVAVRTGVEELVGKVARLFERANIASFENDLERKRLVRDPNWLVVYPALLDSGVLQEEFRQAGGKRQIFVRMSVRPVDLMAGLSSDSTVDARVSAFWAQVANVA